jgi:hypothetical protein
MNKPENKPSALCMAPWTHTYISPQSERRLCCASREPPQSFKQYIDIGEGSSKYEPLALDEWWNSEHVRNVRKKMMSGDVPEECQVCNHKLLNTDVYRDYFGHLFEHKYNEIWETTDETGNTTMKPVSWDYRFTNLCNFKCRMCGDMLSSSWESEERKYGMINQFDPSNRWMKPRYREEIKKFQDAVVDKEFFDAITQSTVEEIYWVGGEPLMMEEHWGAMKQIVEQDDAKKVYVRYNTNLSQIDYKGVNLFKDLLPHFRDWQICASIDGTNETGEYIRTGLKYDRWLENYKKGQEIQTNSRQMRLDFTLTLPGLFELENMFNLSKELNTMILAKVTFAFTPDIAMSPLCLPKELLHNYVNKVLAKIKPHSTHFQRPLIDVLENLLTRKTFEEEWPVDYLGIEGIRKGKRRITRLEEIRDNPITMSEILEQDNDIHAWWESVDELKGLWGGVD